MPLIQRDSLMTLEAYAKARKDFRARVLVHKKARTVHLGGHMTLIFEDELTLRYQIQEMLRIEKAFEEEAIQDELDVYNPLVPNGSNWKATMLIEYEDVEERRAALMQLKGVEDRVWVAVAGFELAPDMVAALKGGAALAVGVDHPAYRAESSPVDEATRDALLADLA
jgi:hypothetical protein